MKQYLNRGIKGLIDEFPAIATILDEFNIGCAPCNVGTCLLKDIVEIHNLNEDQEAILMHRLAKVFYPGQDIQLPEIKRAAAMPGVKAISYSPPMKILVEEHKLIKRWIARIPEIIQNGYIHKKSHQRLIEQGIDFIRSYADRFHHAKEEEILFKYFDERLDIIKAMHQDHETARAHVRAIVEALIKKDEKTIAEHLLGYKELLTEHIKKEDEILYPWMDRNLTMTQVGDLYSNFQAAEAVLSAKQKEKYKQFVEQLEANGLK